MSEKRSAGGRFKDLTGQRFGYLTAVSRADDYICPGNGKRYVRWNCVCDCGMKKTVVAVNLTSGTTISCGCMNPYRLADLTGRRFGRLTVVSLAEPYVNSSGRKLVRYLCRCDCGNEVFELANTLRNGDVNSCGCIVNSRGENLVSEWLHEKKIVFEMHRTFSDCLSKSGYKLSYDFWIPAFHALIECNGLQHYESVDFFGGDERLASQMEHDAIKKKYAEDREYPYLVLDCRRANKSQAVRESIISQLSDFISLLCWDKSNNSH